MIASRPTPHTRCLSADFELIEKVVRMGNKLVDLWEASPIRLGSNQANTDEIIDVMFPGTPLLCCGWTRYYFDTRPRNRWYKLNDLQFIVPNPMTAQSGTTRTQKISAHTLTNTGPRRFLIVEFDFDSSSSALLKRLAIEACDVRDLCAALLLHLAETAPLAMAVYSGGKSLHGWFYCAGVSQEKLRGFFQYAVSLGADRGNWTPSQFTRMPDGLRDNGRRETVYFFNPAVVK